MTDGRASEYEWPALNATDAGRVILRDGSAAIVRPATVDDAAAVQSFFDALSAESRYGRFLGTGAPSPELIRNCCESGDLRRQLTLLALRSSGDDVRPVAVATYVAGDQGSAEVAVAVADAFQGLGFGTVLLERLAAVAVQHGIERFSAVTSGANASMLEVFYRSGFELRSTASHGVVELELDLRPTARGVAATDERNRVATVASLRPLLQPRSVAVIGVSRDVSHMGRRIFDGLIRARFNGAIFPVNPNAPTIDGRECFPSILAIAEPVDLAVIVTAPAKVPRAVEECARAGVRAVVVIGAGFAETGEQGRSLQQALVTAVRTHGMRLVGPNCMGVLNLTSAFRLNASLADRLPPPGRLGLATQSGGVGLALLELASARHIGLSTFVSLGNKADVSGNDLLQWGESDPETSVILLYLESFGNPRRFAQLARRVGRSKPIVAVKAGRTRSGSRAAGSHTAGLASNEAAVTALFKQTGVIRVDTIDEMFDVAELLDLQRLPGGPNVAIVSNAGGPGILAADACDAAALTLPALSDETRRRLAARLPSAASLGNPVDLVASAGAAEYTHAVLETLQADEVDSLIVIYTPIDHGVSDAILAGIADGVEQARAAGIVKPALLCVLDGAAQPPPLAAGAERVPAYMFPENAVRALGRVTAYARWRELPPTPSWTFDDVRVEDARTICREAIGTRGDTWLDAGELRRVLDAFGLGSVDSGAAKTEAEAVELAASFGYPVVLKVQSTRILHKTEVGGVRVSLHDERAVRDAFQDLASRFPDIREEGASTSVVVQPMFAGVETLVGVTHDPVFGPLVAFGLGGVHAELLRDVAFRIAPLSERDVDDLLHDVRSYPLLTGYRGRPAMDVAALRSVLLRVSLLASKVPELRELDLNPLIVLPAGQGCRIVDARLRVASDR